MKLFYLRFTYLIVKLMTDHKFYTTIIIISDSINKNKLNIVLIKNQSNKIYYEL